MEIKRNIFNKLYNEIREPEVSILLGARQVGKTTLLREIGKKAEKEGHKIQFYNLESSSDLAELSGNQEKVFKRLTSSGADVLLIDEFHYLKNASKIFKEIYDSSKKIKIFASGSSSLEIHKHLKESLAGRFRKTMVFPLTLDEFSQIPGNDLKEYLQWGGMPGLVHRKTREEKMELLENIVSTYLTKDIKSLIKEENVRAFNAMLYALAQLQGSMVVASNIARDVSCNESTLARHLEIMSQTYVCHILHSFSRNLANELKKSKKCYLFDIGIRNSLLKDFRTNESREDKGALNESFILQHLVPQLKPNMEIRFWRTKKGAEVDFVLLKDRVPIPIEVKSHWNAFDIPDGMRSFMKTYPKSPLGIIFNEEIQGEGFCEGRKILFRRLWEVSRLPELS